MVERLENRRELVVEGLERGPGFPDGMQSESCGRAYTPQHW
jgi:hypothetical protein